MAPDDPGVDYACEMFGPRYPKTWGGLWAVILTVVSFLLLAAVVLGYLATV